MLFTKVESTVINRFLAEVWANFDEDSHFFNYPYNLQVGGLPCVFPVAGVTRGDKIISSMSGRQLRLGKLDHEDQLFCEQIMVPKAKLYGFATDSPFCVKTFLLPEKESDLVKDMVWRVYHEFCDQRSTLQLEVDARFWLIQELGAKFEDAYAR